MAQWLRNWAWILAYLLLLCTCGGDMTTIVAWLMPVALIYKGVDMLILWTKQDQDFQLCGKFTGHKSCERGAVIFPIFHVTSCWSHDQRIIWLYGWEPLDGQRYCVSKEVFHMLIISYNFTCLIWPLISASKAHGISCLHMQNKSHPGHIHSG